MSYLSTGRDLTPQEEAFIKRTDLTPQINTFDDADCMVRTGRPCNPLTTKSKPGFVSEWFRKPPITPSAPISKPPWLLYGIGAIAVYFILRK